MKKPSQKKTDRLPPHSMEAEQGVLGCVLLSPNECMDEMREALPDAQAFYDLRHQCIYDTLIALQTANVAIDLITLQQKLKERNLLEEIGGLAYLSSLPDTVPSAANLSYYAVIVREKWSLRRWLALSGQIATSIYEHEGELAALVDQMSQDVFKLCESGLRTNEKHIRQVMIEVQEEYLDKFRRGVKRRVGPMTGFNYLDNIVPGLGPAQLVVLAARPRTGKSALAMQIAEYIAGAEAVPVGFVSLEMTSRALGARAVFERGGADMTKFLNGFATDADIQKLANATVALSKMPIIFDESPSLAIEDLEIRARRMVRRHKIGVLFIDYFQLLWSRNKVRSWNTNDELAHCSKRLKALARELNIPVFLCAQMNREIDKETHRRPRLSDLRDTGQLEQDADIVMFLWKPSVKSDKWKKQIEEILPRLKDVPEDWKGKVESAWRDDVKIHRHLGWERKLQIVTCTVEKQREGRSGEDATMVFIKPWTRFVDAYEPRQDKSGDLLPTGAPTEAEHEDEDGI